VSEELDEWIEMARAIRMTVEQGDPGVKARGKGPWAPSTSLGMGATGSAFRQRAQTPAKRLNFDSAQGRLWGIRGAALVRGHARSLDSA